MPLKTAFISAALAAAMATGTAAMPLAYLERPATPLNLPREVRDHRCVYGCRTVCPYWYERTFWGSYRLYSPCSSRVTIHFY